MPAAGSVPSVDSSANSSQGAQESTTYWSPAATVVASPRIDISPRARPSAASGSGGSPAPTGSRIDISPTHRRDMSPVARPSSMPPLERVQDKGKRLNPIVPLIRGMSSTGKPTSGITPEPAYLGTPKEAGRRSRSPPKMEQGQIPNAPPAWVGPIVPSHRGVGSVPRAMEGRSLIPI